jgi:TolB protein
MKRCVEFALLAVLLLPLLGLSCIFASEGKIAFVSDFEQPGQRFFVCIMDPDGSNQIKLGETGIVHPKGLQWSPDGKRIAFCGLGYEIGIADADGKNLNEVGPPVSEDCVISSLSWSPDGAEIAVVGVVPSSLASDIYAINVQGGEARKLTDSPNTSKYEVAWSPDSSQIAFVGFDRVSRDYRHIYLIDADGSNQRLLVSVPMADLLQQISWSPDGKKLMFVHYITVEEIDFYTEIYVVDVEDGTIINLTNTPDIDEIDPAWSPDGKRIAFTTYSPFCQMRIMDADGSNVVKLADGVIGGLGPSWSPDGKKIVFYGGSVQRPGGGEKEWISLFIVDIDSGEVVDLIATGPGDYYSPVWSPR